MIQKDYIMRMIEQLSVVLMKILFNKETKNYTQALLEIDSAYENLLGLNPDYIKAISEGEIVGMLESNGSIDAEKPIIIAELLREEAEIKELENGLNDNVLYIFFKSFYIYVEAIIYDSRYNQKEYLKKLDKIVEKIIKYELPNQIQFKLFQYYEIIGYFGKAEDILYELIDLKYPNILFECKSFYLRLLNKSDEELLSGNLPRNEVNEGLDHIDRMSIESADKTNTK